MSILKSFLFVSMMLLSSEIIAAAPIRFATEATYPPFEYITAEGQIEGFDIAVAEAICTEIKRECTFNNQDFHSLIPSLTMGKYDALIAAISVTKAREKQVAFTNTYYEPSASFVASLASNYTKESILKVTIGTQKGTTFPKYLLDKYPQVKMKSYVSIQEAFLDLKAGRIQAVLTDTPIAKDWLKQNHQQNYGIVVGPIVDHDYFGNGFAIAVNKQNTELLNNLNQGLTAIKQKGIYQKLIQDYFGSIVTSVKP